MGLVVLISGGWLLGDVLGELWGQSVFVGNVIPCLGLLDGTLGEKMGEEVDGVYPLRFAIAGQEFFIENDVPFGVDACSGVAWSSFDGAVDLFILKTFVGQSSVACDPSGGVPAVDVSLLWVQGVRE